jgi:hypothetical protein
VEHSLNILLTEYAQLRESERSARGNLHTINGFATVVVSSMIVGIYNFKVEPLVLVGPLIVFLTGFMYSSEALRVLRLGDFITGLEKSLRTLSPDGDTLPVGFETSGEREGQTVSFLHDSAITIVSAAFYAIFYLAFFFLLWRSEYPEYLKLGLIILYSVFGCLLWFTDLYINRRYLWGRVDRTLVTQ